MIANIKGIAELATRIAKTGASIKDMFHERAWLAANVFSVRVRVVVETRDRAHAEEIRTQLSQKYSQVRSFFLLVAKCLLFRYIFLWILPHFCTLYQISVRIMETETVF